MTFSPIFHLLNLPGPIGQISGARLVCRLDPIQNQSTGLTQAHVPAWSSKQEHVIQPAGLPMPQVRKLGSRGMVAAIVATSLLPSFQTMGEIHGLDDVTPQARGLSHLKRKHHTEPQLAKCCILLFQELAFRVHHKLYVELTFFQWQEPLWKVRVVPGTPIFSVSYCFLEESG